MRWPLVVGALFAGLAVAMAAAAAHALERDLTPQALAWVETASRFQFWHGLGLIAIGTLARTAKPPPKLILPAALLCLGVVLFCGALYLRAFFEIRWITVFAPIGGGAFILGWLSLAILCLRRPVDPG
ncbi:MAG: DUF423 domain-containing protein [Alphaproteobacteria bacterium]|nr:DUF423 domain-containing protein [Alphaproteobacteria bacterium]